MFQIASGFHVKWHAHGFHVAGYGAMRDREGLIGTVNGQDNALRMEMAGAGTQEKAKGKNDAAAT
jgi:hypothetical protein